MKVTPDQLREWKEICEGKVGYRNTRIFLNDTDMAHLARAAMPALIEECVRLRNLLMDINNGKYLRDNEEVK